MFNWNDSTSHVLCNPAFPRAKQAEFQSLLQAGVNWPGHIWCATSGSLVQKWVALSKEALLASAEAVNAHLQATEQDVWVSPLPDFHVGGLGIRARAYLSGANVFDLKTNGKWEAESFLSYLFDTQATLTAMVPAQLYDLVLLNRPPPPALRGVVIGGGVLIESLYQKAAALKWPVMPSYGLTECASQVATAPLGSWEKKERYPPLHLLNHMQAQVIEERLSLKSPSLLSVYAYFNEGEIYFKDPKIEGWFQTEDRVELSGSELKILGRIDSCIKIGGESVDMQSLESLFHAGCLEAGCQQDFALVAAVDKRLGRKVVLVAEGITLSHALQIAVDKYQAAVLPFEKIRKIHYLPSIPRSPLGKILKGQLKIHEE